MLELSDKVYEQKEEKGFKPHVRYRGGWDVIWPHIKSNALSSDEYIGIVLEVKDNTASLYVNNHLELTWILPTHVDVMYMEATSEKKPDQASPDEKYVQEIPFRLQFGMIGFRAHPGQGAIVRGLKVEAL